MSSNILGDMPQDIVSIPSTNIQLNLKNTKTIVTDIKQTIITPKNEDNVRVKVPSKFLGKTKSYLQEQSTIKFPWIDLLLFFSALFLGGTFSALTSNIALNSRQGITFYIILPLISVILLTTYLFIKYQSIKIPSHDAKALLEDFPDY